MIDLSVVTSGAQNVLRTPSLIARSTDDYFLVSVQTRGRGRVRQDGRTALHSAVSRWDTALNVSRIASRPQVSPRIERVATHISSAGQ